MEPKPEKKPSAIEFVKAKLALNPEATYAEIKAQAKFEGVPIYPVVYGRAKALLGLVPTAPYGSKSKARKRKTAEAGKRTEAGTPEDRRLGGNGGVEGPRTVRAKAAARKARAEGDAAAPLEGMIEELKTAVQERDRYRAILEKIAELVRAELEA